MKRIFLLLFTASLFISAGADNGKSASKKYAVKSVGKQKVINNNKKNICPNRPGCICN